MTRHRIQLRARVTHHPKHLRGRMTCYPPRAKKCAPVWESLLPKLRKRVTCHPPRATKRAPVSERVLPKLRMEETPPPQPTREITAEQLKATRPRMHTDTPSNIPHTVIKIPQFRKLTFWCAKEQWSLF